MRTTLLLALSLGLGLAASPGPLAAQRSGSGLAVFEDDNYGGRTVTIFRDTPDLRPAGMDKRISSVRAGAGEFWELCTSRNYGGRCEVIAGSESSLRRIDLNDNIESARRVEGYNRPPAAAPFGQVRGLQLFAGKNYSGQRKVFTAAIANLEREDFNDRAGSLRVGRGEEWEVCVSANYDDCRVVDRDIPDLDVLSFTRIISSVRPRRMPGGAQSGPGGPMRARITIFENPGYTGLSIVVTSAESTLTAMRNRAGSVRLEGSTRWELCEEPRYGGRCVTITGDVRDLSQYGLRDRVASARPR